MKKIVIIGSGSWGTALGILLGNNGHKVIIWDRNSERGKKTQEERENKKYLEGVKIPENILITSVKENLLKDAEIIIFSVPSQSLREVIREFTPQLDEKMVIVNTSKGIEISTGLRLSEVIKEEVLGKLHKNIVVLSGPTHAEEVAVGVPTTIAVAGERKQCEIIQEIFSNETFRVYSGNDIIGAEIGGALKNCFAIGAGILDGLGYGDNIKAALITRGLTEMIRYGVNNGGEERTFTGLTGIGDLIVTCNSRHSRNREVGEKLGKGEKIESILRDMKMVAEGVPTVKAVYFSSEKNRIDIPIISGIYDVIYKGENPKKIITQLMLRETKREFPE